MANRIIVNATTGESETIPVTDEWRLANEPDRVYIDTDNVVVAADEVDVIALSITLLNPLGSNVDYDSTINLLIGDEDALAVVVNAGAPTEVTIAFAEPGVYTIEAGSHPSNQIDIEAV